MSDTPTDHQTTDQPPTHQSGGFRGAASCSLSDVMTRRTRKCEECPFAEKKPSQRTRDELAYARCTPPKDFPCHMEELYYGDTETMCRGHWEMFRAAEQKGIEADEEAGDRIGMDIY